MHEDEVLFTEFFNQKLKERGLSLKQLSDSTGIAIKHLESFGHGRFEHLPPAPYLRGYFVKLGPILGFEPDEWWSRIKSEETVHRAGPTDRMPSNRFSKMRGQAILWGGIIVILIGVYFTARFTTIIGEPRLILTAPSAELSTTSMSVIIFQGRIQNGDSLIIGGNNIPLAADKSFNTEISLQPGQNTIELHARKTLGREVTLTRHIYYDNSQIIAPAPSAPSASSTDLTSP